MEEKAPYSSHACYFEARFIRIVSKFLLILSLLGAIQQVPSAAGLSDDGKVLMGFAGGISADPSGALASWNFSDTSPCRWNGVRCSTDQVMSLALPGANLRGRLEGAGLGKLAALQLLNLSSNFLEGTIPTDLGDCKQLKSLDLSSNILSGPIPVRLGQLTSLRTLNLGGNGLINSVIPPQLGNLTRLLSLNLSSNSLAGSIPSQLGNLTRLKELRLHQNQLTGSIPKELSKCRSLTALYLDSNKITGQIPEELGDLSQLVELKLFGNKLNGSLPSALSKLSSLQVLDVSVNNLTGTILPALSNLTSLSVLDLAANSFTGALPSRLGEFLLLQTILLADNSFDGPIPPELGRLRNLTVLSLPRNALTGIIPAQILREGSILSHLDISSNNLGGNIPTEIGSLHLLEHFDCNGNGRINGSIPKSMGNCTNLVYFDISGNQVSGALPKEMGLLQKLGFWNISGNLLTGELPQEMQNCTSLVTLDVSRNFFEGPIPSGIGNLENLDVLLMNDNQLSSDIPSTLGGLAKLVKLNLGGNELSGALPTGLPTSLQTGLNISFNHLSGGIPTTLLLSLTSLENLDLSHNNISGELPPTIQEMRSLRNLDLSNNNLSGVIPVALGTLPLEELDLSYNQLSGRVPESLGDVQSLTRLNVSFNNLSGALPSDDGNTNFTKFGTSAFLGNPELCGSPPLLQACALRDTKKTIGAGVWIGIILGGCAALCVVVVCGVACIRGGYYKTKSKLGADRGDEIILSQAISAYSIRDVAQHLTDEDIVGRGPCGTVYKAVAPESENLVALKKIPLNLGRNSSSSANPETAYLSYVKEIKKAGRIRHASIVKLLGFCRDGDFSYVVYDYMSNGSLGDVLHGSSTRAPKFLDWNARYNIALMTSQAISYLHHDCVPQILHRNIKSNNVLLDEALEPHITDFKFVEVDLEERGATLSEDAAGTFGYVAPEYTLTQKMTEKDDVYSFGEVLLELLTGKSIHEPSLMEQGLSLVGWASRNAGSITADALSASGRERAPYKILDKKLIAHATVRDEFYHPGHAHEMTLVLKIALLCTLENPAHRPDMREVVDMLRTVRL